MNRIFSLKVLGGMSRIISPQMRRVLTLKVLKQDQRCSYEQGIHLKNA